MHPLWRLILLRLLLQEFLPDEHAADRDQRKDRSGPGIWYVQAGSRSRKEWLDENDREGRKFHE